MNKDTKLLFAHKVFYDVYFYGAITIPFFVAKGYGVSAALGFASAYMVLSMVAEIPTGIVGDRFGHKMSVMSGAFLTGVAFLGLLAVDNIVWDAAWITVSAAAAALNSGSDTALLRSVSSNFKRDNRTFDYLKSVMLLLSFASAGFIVDFVSIDFAIGLSGLLAFMSVVPLLFVSSRGDSENSSVLQQIHDLPKAVRKVSGGYAAILLAGVAGAVTFSAKEVISSFNTVYGVDISLIGIIAALAMAGRIIGTALEKRVQVGSQTLLFILMVVAASTAIIEFNRTAGIVMMLTTTVVAQMLFYRLKYRLSHEAPQSHVATILSGLGLVGRLASGGIIFMTGLFAGAGYFYLSFVGTAVFLVIVGVPAVRRLGRQSSMTKH